MNLSWANHLAKTALKTAQQKIDSVLDIRPEDDIVSISTQEHDTNTLFVANTSEISGIDENSPPPPSSGNGENWTNSWSSSPGNHKGVVDSEPNPIRDECPQTGSLFDHSPSSNSSDGVEPGQSPLKASGCEDNKQIDTNGNKESVYVDVDLSVTTAGVYHMPSSSDTTIPTENVLLYDGAPNSLNDNVRRNSHQDDSLTIASSDIEVIRNVDAWSVASSKPATDNVSSHVFASKNETTESFRAQLLHAEQRRNELKTANDTLQSNNIQLQQRITVLNQQQALLKKELDRKKAELEDLLTEGKRLSDHSGKQAREIRRLRSELAELEKIKSERKRLKEEKMRAEEMVELQKEEVSSLKGMVKQLEANAEHLVKEQSMLTSSTETAQKHAQEQEKRINELGCELAEAGKKIIELNECNRKLAREAQLMQSANWSERLAGERANETIATISTDLQEARAHIERLEAQLRSSEIRLDVVLNERSNVAESFSQANIPLLDEINTLKLSLHHEQRSNEELDAKMRAMKCELDIATEQLSKFREINDSLVTNHHQELTIVSQKVQHLERDLIRIQNEKEKILSDNKITRATDALLLDTLREENATLKSEYIALQKSMEEIKGENESLSSMLVEMRQQAERSQLIGSLSKVHHFGSKIHGDVPFSSPNVVSFAQTLRYNSVSAQQPDLSLKRISFLEHEAVRCSHLEDQVRSLKKELQVLNSQHNRLLIVDGERLERIEELEQDVFDLRQLLKDQLVAFVEARIVDDADK